MGFDCITLLINLFLFILEPQEMDEDTFITEKDVLQKLQSLNKAKFAIESKDQYQYHSRPYIKRFFHCQYEECAWQLEKVQHEKGDEILNFFKFYFAFFLREITSKMQKIVDLYQNSLTMQEIKDISGKEQKITTFKNKKLKQELKQYLIQISKPSLNVMPAKVCQCESLKKQINEMMHSHTQIKAELSSKVSELSMEVARKDKQILNEQKIKKERIRMIQVEKEELVRKNDEIQKEISKQKQIGLSNHLEREQQQQSLLKIKCQKLENLMKEKQQKSRAKFGKIHQFFMNLKKKIAVQRREINSIKHALHQLQSKPFFDFSKQWQEINSFVGNIATKVPSQEKPSPGSEQIHLFTTNLLSGYSKTNPNTNLMNYKKQRQFLISCLEQSMKKKIIRSKFLYQSEKVCHISAHVHIDSLPNIVFLIRLENNELLAAFTELPIEEDVDNEGVGFLSSLSRQLVVYPNTKLKKGYKVTLYDQYYFVFGNSDMRFSAGEGNTLFSNIGHRISFYDTDYSVQQFTGSQEREMKIDYYEAHQLIFR